MHRFSIAVCLALVACGGGDDQNGHLADAPLLIDGPNPDAPVQPAPPVTLTITSNGMPVPGVTVYFVNADDSLAAAAQTDAAGTASARIADGGSVTAVNPFPAPVVAAAVRNGDDLRTFVGVKPGDHLVLTGALPSVSFTLNAKAVSGAAEYLVLTSCGSASIPVATGSSGSGPDPTGSVTLFGCGGTADMLVIARNSDFVPMSALYHAGAPLTEGGTVDLTGDAYQPVADLGLGYTNVSPNTGSVSLAYALGTGRGVFAPLFNDSAGPVGGTAMFAEQAPSFAGAIGVIDTSLRLNSEHHVIDWAPYTASYMLDLTSLLLPDMIATPSFNPTTQRVSWTEDVVGAAPDLTTAALRVTREVPFRSWHWELAAPYTPGEIKLPRLPTDVFDWTPTINDAVIVEHVMNAKLPGRYDAVRAHMLDIEDKLDAPGLGVGEQNHADFVAGASGRVALVQFFEPLALRRAR
ncbi:MAG TPA: hypothetical protein VF469_20515 [Kofleriaceae bacterium]